MFRFLVFGGLFRILNTCILSMGLCDFPTFIGKRYPLTGSIH